MLDNINIEEVKQYNDKLKQYRDKASALKAEIEYTNKEITALCGELTNELGIQVTPENIKQIYAEQIEKIKSALQSGNAVLAKISSEEQRLSQQGTAQAEQQTPQMQTAPQMQMQTQPQMQAPQMQMQMQQPQTQAAPQMQMNQTYQQAPTMQMGTMYQQAPQPQAASEQPPYTVGNEQSQTILPKMFNI